MGILASSKLTDSLFGLYPIGHLTNLAGGFSLFKKRCSHKNAPRCFSSKISLETTGASKMVRFLKRSEKINLLHHCVECLSAKSLNVKCESTTTTSKTNFIFLLLFLGWIWSWQLDGHDVGAIKLCKYKLGCLSAIMLSVIILSVVMLSVIMLSVIMLNVI